VSETAALVDLIHRALPQTQCTRCGYPDCRGYADAIADGRADINRCPPGGTEGIRRLAAITGRPPMPLDPSCGTEGPRHVARIDEAWCIGCTLCMDACPVDCIVGAPRQMHSVIADHCTGCELCLPPCPVDCIELVDASGGRTGWQAWSPAQAEAAGERYRRRQERLAAAAGSAHAQSAATPDAGRKRSIIDAALERARAQRTG
jgi:electron transport complex protein RnfB